MANWKSFPTEDGKYSIYEIDDAGNKLGSAIGETHDTKLQADLAIADMYAGSDTLLVDENGGYGPTLLAIAATNEPFIGLKDHPTSVVDVNGTQHVRVPFLIQGFYFHPWYGPLVYNQPKVDMIMRNHLLGVAEAPVYFRVNHSNESPSVAFFDVARGGWLQEEVINDDKLVCAYGPVVDGERAIETVRDFVCASMDIDDNYIPARIQKFNRPARIFSLNSNWRFSHTRTEAMAMKRKVTIAGQTFEVEVTEAGYVFDEAAITALGAITLPEAVEDLQPQVDTLTTDLTAARGQIVTLEAKVKELGGNTEPEVPAAVQARIDNLERLAHDAERREFESQVGNVLMLARGFRDDAGNGHSQVFVDFLGAFLKGAPIGTGTDVVKLEKNYDLSQYKRYCAGAVMWLSTNLSGTVPMEGRTSADNQNPMRGPGTSDEAELAEMAKKHVERYVKKTGFQGKKFEQGRAN